MARLIFGGLTALLLVIMGLLFPGAAAAQTDEPEKPRPPTPQPTWRLPNQDTAVAQAEALLGTTIGNAASVEKELKILEGDRTPSLSAQANGRPVWVVTLVDLELDLPVLAGKASKMPRRTFDVVLDAEDGHLIKISSPWPDGMGFRLEAPEPDVAEGQLWRSRRRYTGFVESPRPVTFMRALNTVEGKGGTRGAVQLIAQLIEHEDMGRKKPVWIITMRGTEPMRHYDGWRKPGPRFQQHCLVDAESGQLLVRTNVPEALVIEEE